MKKLFSFSKKKQSPSRTPDRGNALCVGYEVKEKDLGKFHKAAWRGDVAKLEHLVKSNNVNQVDKHNRTALHLACACGNAEVVRFLVEKRAKLNLCDNQSRSALMKAVQGQYDMCAKILLENHADPNLVDTEGNTALHLASSIPSISTVENLVDHDADINAQNKEGVSPLTLAVQADHLEVAEILLKKGADVNILDGDQRSSLMMAAGNGHISMVRTLLQFHADITLKDNKGHSAEDYAVIEGHHPCAILITEHAAQRNRAASLSHPGPSKKKSKSELGIASRALETGFAVGGPATDKDDFEDNSQAESLSRNSKKGGTDEWASSEDDCESLIVEKTPPKMNLRKMLESKRGKAKCLSEPAEGKQGTVEQSSESQAQSSEGESSEEEEEEEEVDEEDEEEEDEDNKESEEIEEEEEEESEDDSCLSSSQSNTSSSEDAQKPSLVEVDLDNEKTESKQSSDRVPSNDVAPPDNSPQASGTSRSQMLQSLDVDQDFVVSAIRVESKYSDEDDELMLAPGQSIISNLIMRLGAKMANEGKMEELEKEHDDDNKQRSLKDDPKASQRNILSEGKNRDVEPDTEDAVSKNEKRRSSWGSSLEEADNHGCEEEDTNKTVCPKGGKATSPEGTNHNKYEIPPLCSPRSKNRPSTGESDWDSPTEEDEGPVAGKNAQVTSDKQLVEACLASNVDSRPETLNENTTRSKVQPSRPSEDQPVDDDLDPSENNKDCASLRDQSTATSLQHSKARNLPEKMVEEENCFKKASVKFTTDAGCASPQDNPHAEQSSKELNKEKTSTISSGKVDAADGHSDGSVFSEPLPHTDIDDVDLDSPDEKEDDENDSQEGLHGDDEDEDDDEDQEEEEEEEEVEEDEDEEDISDDQLEGNGGLLDATTDVEEKRDVSKDTKSGVYSELGLEKEEEEEQSWDSEQEEDHRLPNEDEQSAQAQNTGGEQIEDDLLCSPSFLRGAGGGWMPEPWWSRGRQKGNLGVGLGAVGSVTENKDSMDAGDVQQEDPTQNESEKTKWGLLLSKCEGKNKEKTDLMEELGLGDFDYAEDASDWDTSSNVSKKSLPGCIEASSPAPKEFPQFSSKEKESDDEKPLTAPHPQPRSKKTLPQKSDEPDWNHDNSPSSCTEANTENQQLQEAVREGYSEVSTMAEDKKSHLQHDKLQKEVVGKTSEVAVTVKNRSAVSDTIGSALEGFAIEKSEVGSASRKETSGQAEASQQTQKPLTFDRSQVESQLSHQRTASVRKPKEQTSPLAGGRKALTPKTPQTDNRELSLFDDSTLSDVSDDEGRYKTGEQRKKQQSQELDMSEDIDELNSSSDVTTDDSDFRASGHRCSSLFIQNLDSLVADSRSMVKLQNIFHKYERSIQKAKSRHSFFADKVSLLETEKAQLRKSLDEVKDFKSALERNQLDLQTEVTNLKFQLKQEQENGRNATMMYNTTGDKLRRTEEQRQVEVQERQKVELALRNLELEMRILVNNNKQLEEDNSQTQTLLAQERSARTVLENLLNSHVRKQQEIEEENKRNISKSHEALSQLTEASDRERELLQQISIFHEQLSTLRTDLENSQANSSIKQRDLQEENKALKEQLKEARRALKANGDSLNQTVLDFNNQTATMKSELTVTATRLENERQTRETVAAELESVRARLTAAMQEAERCMAARSDAEKALLQEKEEHRRLKDRLSSDASSQHEAVNSLSQKLSKAESHANSMENEAHRVMLQLTEKNLLLNTVQRDSDQKAARIKELEAALQAEKELVTRAGARQEATQERLAQAQSEGMLLRQQLEEAQNKGVAKENAVTDAQKSFSDILSKLRADCEDRVQLVQDRNQELATKAAELREHIHQLQEEKNEREANQRELQQELADSLKKLSMCEASLEINTRYRNDLEEEKTRLLKDMDSLKGKMEQRESQCLQVEKHVNDLRCRLDEREKELSNATQKHQEALSAAAASDAVVKQLEEAVQRLEIENVKLEAAAKQQSNKLEALQKGSQEEARVRAHLEDMVTNLQSSKMTLEDQLNKEVQKQSVLSDSARDTQAMWEEELKSRSKLGLRLAEFEKEKGELSSQMELVTKKAKKLAEQKKAVDCRLEQEMERNTELQKEMYRLRTLLKTAKRRLRGQDTGGGGGGGDFASPLSSLKMDLGRHSRADGAIDARREKVCASDAAPSFLNDIANTVCECFCYVFPSQVRDLQGEPESGAFQGSLSERRLLEEEVLNLKRRVEASEVEQRQQEQYRREVEEKARQEIHHKLQEVNIFLQSQAATQEAQDQIKAANEASLRLKIQELESELNQARTFHHDSFSQRESTRTELERFKELYRDEQKLRKSLSADLKRTNHQLSEASSRLVNERGRSLITSPGPAPAPSAGVASLGGPYRGLTSRLLSPVIEGQSSSVEDYLTMMQRQLDRSISRELNKASAELDVSLARMSPVGSASRVDPDPVNRAKQQYLEVLKKNHEV
ncbi:ankyrin repeat domain-containing protein 26 isoform X7 [Vanacampus margaritifer]